MVSINLPRIQQGAPGYVERRASGITAVNEITGRSAHARRATTFTGTASLKLNRDPLGSQFTRRFRASLCVAATLTIRSAPVGVRSNLHSHPASFHSARADQGGWSSAAFPC